ncbi:MULTISPECIES: YkgJ family cysteine cluster protein [unclassified Candidatus Protochlamydia]|uniref:YkgJ family cysteine cluster protein n=1 Tax=unclassified Candidatus Protochlamydia TaxID=2644816 RepID=UPI0005A8AC5C|nr:MULTISPECIES: YkgJ family cysteine cluster protein [unclassified Candidatus Protochlamydia]
MLKIIKEENPWYAEGLSFECTGCGQCCTGAPGYIWVNEEEIKQIAFHLHLSIQEFADHYLRSINGRFSLLERPQTYDCVFLKDKKCQIYSVRPTQCRTYPWWPQNLKTKKDWKEAAKWCEGISETAPVVSVDKIREQLQRQLRENNQP